MFLHISSPLSIDCSMASIWPSLHMDRLDRVKRIPCLAVIGRISSRKPQLRRNKQHFSTKSTRISTSQASFLVRSTQFSKPTKTVKELSNCSALSCKFTTKKFTTCFRYFFHLKKGLPHAQSTQHPRIKSKRYFRWGSYRVSGPEIFRLHKPDETGRKEQIHSININERQIQSFSYYFPDFSIGDIFRRQW